MDDWLVTPWHLANVGAAAAATLATAAVFLARRGLPRTLRAAGLALLLLAGVRVGLFAADRAIYTGLRMRPGVTQGQWLPLLQAIWAADGVAKAAAFAVVAAAVLAGRPPAAEEPP